MVKFLLISVALLLGDNFNGNLLISDFIRRLDDFAESSLANLLTHIILFVLRLYFECLLRLDLLVLRSKCFSGGLLLHNFYICQVFIHLRQHAHRIRSFLFLTWCQPAILSRDRHLQFDLYCLDWAWPISPGLRRLWDGKVLNCDVFPNCKAHLRLPHHICKILVSHNAIAFKIFVV